MLAPLMRVLAAPFAAAVVVLTGLPDFTALDRAVSKALGNAEAQADTAAVKLITVLPSPRILVDTEPKAPAPSPALTVPRAEQRTREQLSFGQRPGDGALVPLYASFVALQGLDVHSTLRAIDRGGREMNGFMAPFTERPAAFVALKAGSTAGILYLTERVRRHSPTAAIVMMAAFNSAYATVVANNYRVGNRLR